MSKTTIAGKWVPCIYLMPETLPPKDGTWVEAKLRTNLQIIALQFDTTLNRWFNGRGHAVAEKDIASWFKAGEP